MRMWKIIATDIAILCGFLLASLGSLRALQAQPAERQVRGVDVVVLVDISRSMSENNQGGTGSDPERIRWDAVKLILDLLTPSDRIMIRRFNTYCPIHSLLEHKKYEEEVFAELKLAGAKKEFPEKFEWLSASRLDLAECLGVFNRIDDKSSISLGRLDYSGTHIVGALRSVAAELSHSRKTRSPHVILLTDGLCREYSAAYLRSKLFELKKRQKDSGGANVALQNELDALRNVFPTELRELEQGSYSEKEYQSPDALFDTLAAYTEGLKPIPVHIVGLKLDAAEGKEKAKLAREFLRRLRHQTGGQFSEVQDSADLIPTSVQLIKEIKGYWVDDRIKAYRPQADVLESKVESLVVNGIVDLGVLSYEEVSGPNVAEKYRIRPPEQELSFDWLMANGQRKPDQGQHDHRTGKDNKLYRYEYFGPASDAQTGDGPSPFAEYREPVTLQMKMRGTNATQRLILLKGTVDLFELECPRPGTELYRHQSLTVRVRMEKSDYFEPEHFEAWARIRPVQTGMEKTSGQDRPEPTSQDGLVVRLESSMQANNGSACSSGLGFTGKVQLTELPRSMNPKDDYEVAVWLVGRSGDAIAKHALSGHRRDLIPRTFSVKNELRLEPLKPITLSVGSPTGIINVQTSYPVDGDIEFIAAFELPQFDNGKPVSSESLKISFSAGNPSEGRLILKQGQGKVQFSLNDDKSLNRKAKYKSGILRLSDPQRLIPPPPYAQPQATVGMRLDVGTIKLTPLPESLAAGPAEVKTVPIQVALDPPDQPNFGIQPVKVSLELIRQPAQPEKVGGKPASAAGTDGAESSPKKGDEADKSDQPVKDKVEDQSKAGLAFAPNELWLAKDGVPAVGLPSRSQSIDQLELTERFRVHLEARGNHAPGKYQYRLKVGADWIDPIETIIEIEVDTARIEVDGPVQTLYLTPGGKGRAVFHAWLSGFSGGSQPVHVDRVRSGQQVVFASESMGPAGQFRVSCPDSDQPQLLVSAPTEPAANNDAAQQHHRRLAFDVQVPPETPYGRYMAELTLTGPDVVRKTIRLHVVVNALEFDIAQATVAGAGTKWIAASEERVSQFKSIEMTQVLRIRNGLREPLQLNQISVVPVGPFRDDASDVQQLPRVAKTILTKEGHVEVHVKFLAEEHFNNKGQSYQISLTAQAESLKVPAANFVFRVHFLDPNDLIKETPIPNASAIRKR